MNKYEISNTVCGLKTARVMGLGGRLNYCFLEIRARLSKTMTKKPEGTEVTL